MNNPKFIYVFNENDKIKLLSSGYTLIKEDNIQRMYVFENTAPGQMTFDNMEFVLSDTLTF